MSGTVINQDLIDSIDFSNFISTLYSESIKLSLKEIKKLLELNEKNPNKFQLTPEKINDLKKEIEKK